MAIKQSEAIKERVNKLSGWLSELANSPGTLQRDEQGRVVDIDQLSALASRVTDIVVEFRVLISDFGFLISKETKVREYLKKVTTITDVELDEVANLEEVKALKKA